MDFDSEHAAAKDIATDPILAPSLGGIFTLGATTAAAVGIMMNTFLMSG